MFDLKIEGLDLFIDMIEAHQKNIKYAIRQATRIGGRVILRHYKQLCPVSEDGNYNHKPGNLKRSIAAKVLKPKTSDKALALIGARTGKREKYDGWYAGMVIKGTVKTPPHPFPQQAMDESINKAMEEAAIEFYKQLDDIAKKDVQDIADIILED
jgi:HK97 gp10 family phage protein